MPRKSHQPVSSFGPELLAALISGGTRELRISLSSFESAFALRQRFYSLRKSMTKENHPQLPMAYRASIPLPLKKPDGTATLVIRPRDNEFTEALRAAGISTPELPSNPLSEIEIDQPEQTNGPPSESWLSSILSGVESK